MTQPFFKNPSPAERLVEKAKNWLQETSDVGDVVSLLTAIERHLDLIAHRRGEQSEQIPIDWVSPAAFDTSAFQYKVADYKEGFDVRITQIITRSQLWQNTPYLLAIGQPAYLGGAGSIYSFRCLPAESTVINLTTPLVFWDPAPVMIYATDPGSHFAAFPLVVNVIGFYNKVVK